MLRLGLDKVLEGKGRLLYLPAENEESRLANCFKDTEEGSEGYEGLEILSYRMKSKN
jgi:hypothetical protein